MAAKQITEEYTITVNRGDSVDFKNNVDYCVGTGRIGLALQKEYMEQLKYVQENIGFKHIRGHGLFSDDMAIFHTYEDENGNPVDEYNFTYLDLVMDGYLECNIRPFIELGFMPGDLASGEQTIFYWKGNVTPPKSYDRWKNLIIATLNHLIDRYGRDEVVTWPVEVWNEPNLPGFWKGADMEEYFRLFTESLEAVKSVDERFKVGGPAICGVDDVRWMECFVRFCHEHNIKPDFITRHHYTTELPEKSGHYGYPELSDASEGFMVLQKSRDIIDSYPEFKDMDMHITEFNTSYVPNAPLHDTNQNAAYIAYLLSRMGEMNESYSYWTFGDIFEEMGVPYTPFHGGFGMVANGSIPKPTFWTFKFFKDIGSDCVYKGRNAVITKSSLGYRGVLWNDSRKRDGRELEININLPALSNSNDMQAALIVKTVDEENCNPLKAWHDIGSPASLNKEQKALLKDIAHPVIQTGILGKGSEDISFNIRVREHGVIYFEVNACKVNNDRGYDFDRTVQKP